MIQAGVLDNPVKPGPEGAGVFQIAEFGVSRK